MGKFCCSEMNGDHGLDFMGLLMALVIALALMVICTSRPRRAMMVCRFP
ncbi:hypothetical protein OIU74_007952 [Salix koriyanagi]|uniref:Uncharacterized protein n=1 Tax=Salix koriyanagi TaxID=2511006 RepID=A0A9Q0U4X5_9ROSI|nr:hypothetical protein OIU74_007952 [Salix koriyanagi]